MLKVSPRIPFSPHLLGEENDENIVHYDKGKSCARCDAEDDDRRDQAEGERDSVGLVQLGSH